MTYNACIRPVIFIIGYLNYERQDEKKNTAKIALSNLRGKGDKHTQKLCLGGYKTPHSKYKMQ